MTNANEMGSEILVCIPMIEAKENINGCSIR